MVKCSQEDGQALVGSKVSKLFDGHGWFEGKVQGYKHTDPYPFTIKYSDGDKETATYEELLEILVDSNGKPKGSKGKRKSSAAEEQGKKKSKRSRKSKAAEEEEEEEAAEEQEEEEAAEDDGGSEDVDAEPAPKSASKGRGKGKASKGKGAGTSAAAAAPAQPPASPAPSTKRGRKAAAAAGGSLGDLVADAHALGAQAATEICPVRLTGADPALKGFAGTALANVSYKVLRTGSIAGDSLEECLAQLDRILAAAGASKQRLQALQIVTEDATELELQEAWNEWVGKEEGMVVALSLVIGKGPSKAAVSITAEASLA